MAFRRVGFWSPPAASGLTAAPWPAPRAGALRVGLLSNPLSGRNRDVLDLVRAVRSRHLDVPCREAASPLQVTAALRELTADGVQVVAVNGGDGTVQAVLTALCGGGVPGPPPLLALLHGGTTNMIAGDVGLRGPRKEALDRLLAWARGSRPGHAVTDRAVIRLESPERSAPVFGMFFGAGAVYEGIRFCRGEIHPWGLRGELAAGLALVRFLLALALGRGRDGILRPVPLTATWDKGGAVNGEHVLLLVSTLERLLLGLRPFWGEGPGRLRMTAVGRRPQRLLRALPSLLRGRPSPHGIAERGYASCNVEEIRLELEGGYTLDGELFAAHPGQGPIVLRDGGRISFVRC